MSAKAERQLLRHLASEGYIKLTRDGIEITELGYEARAQTYYMFPDVAAQCEAIWAKDKSNRGWLKAFWIALECHLTVLKDETALKLIAELRAEK